MALPCQLWGRSVSCSSARCQADCEANACQSGWRSPRGPWCDYSWLFFLVLPTSLHCAQDCTQRIWLCCIEATLLCLSVQSVPARLLQPLRIWALLSSCRLRSLHLGSCTVWEISCSTAPVLRACSWAAIIKSSVFALMLLFLVIDICRLCLQILTHLCARRHAAASYTRLQLHLVFFRWL